MWKLIGTISRIGRVNRCERSKAIYELWPDPREEREGIEQFPRGPIEINFFLVAFTTNVGGTSVSGYKGI